MLGATCTVTGYLVETLWRPALGRSDRREVDLLEFLRYQTGMVRSQPIGPFGLETYVPRGNGGPHQGDPEQYDQETRDQQQRTPAQEPALPPPSGSLIFTRRMTSPHLLFRRPFGPKTSADACRHRPSLRQPLRAAGASWRGPSGTRPAPAFWADGGFPRRPGQLFRLLCPTSGLPTEPMTGGGA